MTRKVIDYFNGDELAANVWSSKYALSSESSPDDMHRRMAKEFAKIESHYNEDDCLSEEEIYNLFKDFRYVIPQGSIMSTLGSDLIASLSNCFVVGQPTDSYGGIFRKDQEIAQLEKRRGGVGIDISTLRPSGTPVKNVAKTSTGAVSFMHRFSNTTREVAQGGRRK